MKTAVYNSNGDVVIARVTASSLTTPETTVDQEHAINFKTADDTPFTNLVDKVLPGSLLCVPGGTISQDIGGSTLSQIQLDGIALMGSKLIYSVNINNPVATEQAQIDALKGTNEIPYYRLGNEYYTYRPAPEVNATEDDQAAFDLGAADGSDYIAECMPFISGLDFGGGEIIMVGASESNQRSDKFNAYRRGFNSSVIAFCEGKGYLMDFHHYHRDPTRDLFDTTLFEATLALLGNTRAIVIESGALTGAGQHTEATYTSYAIDTVQKVNAILRPTDIMGAHLLRQSNGVGLTTPDGTALSAFGEAFFDLSKVKSTVTPGVGGDGYITKKVVRRIPAKYAYFILRDNLVVIGDRRNPIWYNTVKYSVLVSPTGPLDTAEKADEAFSVYFGK